MTTGWLLLLLLVEFSHSVVSQPTTDDVETYCEGGTFGKLQSDVERLFDNQRELFLMIQHYQTIVSGLGKC